MEHTKGPWRADGRWIVIDGYQETERGYPSGVYLAQVEPMPLGYKKETAQANARLIAAAPDLLDALEYVLMDHGNGYSDLGWNALETIKAALKKAKGK